MTKENTTLGVIGFIISILSIILISVSYIGLPLAIVGLILSTIQRNRKPTGLAKAGFVIGIIGIIFNFIGVIILVSSIGSSDSISPSTQTGVIIANQTVPNPNVGKIEDTASVIEEPYCPNIVKATTYEFHWADDINGNRRLWLYADFVKRIQFSNEWELATLPSTNEFMQDNLICEKGSQTGESINKLYCKGTLTYNPKISKSNIDSDGNIISTDYLELTFVFDLAGKNINNANDLASLRMDSLKCSEPGLW